MTNASRMVHACCVRHAGEQVAVPAPVLVAGSYKGGQWWRVVTRVAGSHKLHLLSFCLQVSTAAAALASAEAAAVEARQRLQAAERELQQGEARYCLVCSANNRYAAKCCGTA
jgi:hypothetical protein